MWPETCYLVAVLVGPGFYWKRPISSYSDHSCAGCLEVNLDVCNQVAVASCWSRAASARSITEELVPHIWTVVLVLLRPFKILQIHSSIQLAIGYPLK